MSPKTVKNLSTSSKQAGQHAAKKPAVKAERYFEARGGRKTSVSRVRLVAEHSGVTVNGKDLKTYFPEADLQETVRRPLVALNLEGKMSVSAHVRGGGLRGQASAISLGIARALTLYDGALRAQLRHENLLTRDSRAVERKKYGLRKARRAPQWAKR